MARLNHWWGGRAGYVFYGRCLMAFCLGYATVALVLLVGLCALMVWGWAWWHHWQRYKRWVREHAESLREDYLRAFPEGEGE
jgi:hypothetical protein